MPEDAALYIGDRIRTLEARREELRAQIDTYIEKALAPIDTTLAELRSILAVLAGNGRVAPPQQEYDVPPLMEGVSPLTAKDSFTSPRQMRRTTRSSSPTDFVASPDTNTPVPTNEKTLKDAIAGKR